MGMSTMARSAVLSAVFASGINVATADTSAVYAAIDEMNNQNPVATAIENRKLSEITLPEKPMKNAHVPFADRWPGGGPITQTNFQVSREQFFKNNDELGGVYVLVVKGGNEEANKHYERAVLTSARNSSMAYEDETAKVEAVLGVNPEDGLTKSDGGSTSGSILVYVNQHPVAAFAPDSLQKSDLLENIKQMQSYLLYTFEEGNHKLTNAELGKKLGVQGSELDDTPNGDASRSSSGSGFEL